MKRRWAGLVLIILVLAAAAVLPDLQLGVKSGTPEAAPIPVAPAVGDCLIDAPPTLFNVNSSSQGEYEYSQLRIGPCSGNRYGEIVSVSGQAPNDASDLSSDTCSPPASTYVGLPMVDARPSPLFVLWYPSISAEWFLSGPSQRQRAAGQRWSACILYLPSGDPRTVSQKYIGTLRNAFRTGVESNLLGVCPDDLSWNGSNPDGCASPHTAEVFGTDYFIGFKSVSRVQMLLTCRELVQEVTGMTDVTGAGTLAVQIEASSPDGYPVTGPEIPPSAYVKCGIQVLGKRQLAGSLLALGHKPIPWI